MTLLKAWMCLREVYHHFCFLGVRLCQKDGLKVQIISMFMYVCIVGGFELDIIS